MISPKATLAHPPDRSAWRGWKGRHRARVRGGDGAEEVRFCHLRPEAGCGHTNSSPSTSARASLGVLRLAASASDRLSAGGDGGSVDQSSPNISPRRAELSVVRSSVGLEGSSDAALKNGSEAARRRGLPKRHGDIVKGFQFWSWNFRRATFLTRSLL
jgi:hypothetical protein